MRRLGHEIRDRRWTCALLALGALLVCLSPAAAQSNGVVARAAGVTGRAVLSSGPGSPAVALTAGYVLNPGDRIDTRGGGRVVIDLNDGSMVVVQPESLVILKDFRAADSLRELFEIAVGMVRVKINHFAGRPNPYRMNSPTASIAVRGTEFTIQVGAEGETQVVVFEGAVEVASLADPDQTVLVEAGRAVLVQAGQDFHTFSAPANREAANQSHAGDHAHQGSKQAPAAHAPVAGGTPQAAPHAQGEPHFMPHHDRDASSPRAIASTYDRYIAGLADAAQLPFLFRFNAFAESHLDSLENPAYATSFHTGEGRVFLLPSLSGGRDLQENAAAFGPDATLPGNYSLSPQVSVFTPIHNSSFVAGGAASASLVGNNDLGTTLASAPAASGLTTNDGNVKGSSTGNFFSGALVVARAVGSNSFGLELEKMKGTGSLDSSSTVTTGTTPYVESVASHSNVSQVRLTAGFSRDLSAHGKLGVFYRYAFVNGNDGDRSHTVNDIPLGLNTTRSTGHSSELGFRFRDSLTSRLFYGVAGAWLGVSLSDALIRCNTVASHQRDRAQRGSLAAGAGYLLTPRTVVSFDLASGIASTRAYRAADASGAVLQTGAANNRFLSAHVAVQRDVSRHLFVSASLLDVWRAHHLNSTVFADQYGHRIALDDSFFRLTPTAYKLGSHFSDYAAGWRFTRNLFAQYVLSTDYGINPATHSLMVRYTFGIGKE